MKSKIILIPFIMTTCLLGGCVPEGEFIEISEYLNLTNDEGTGYFDIGDLTIKDYECAVQKIFKKYVDKLTKSDDFVFPEVECDSVSFSIASEYKDYTYFTIHAFSSGLVNTICNGNRKEQKTTYLIDRQIANNLIQEVKDRKTEIDDTVEEYRQAAIESHNIDKFFLAAEALENKTFTYNDNHYAGNGTLDSYTSYRINDTDGELTAEMKDVGYRFMPDHQRRRKDYCIEYKINNGWYFQLFNTNYYVATVHYKYSNPFYDTEVQMAYDINDRTKVDTLVKKIKEMNKTSI